MWQDTQDHLFISHSRPRIKHVLKEPWFFSVQNSNQSLDVGGCGKDRATDLVIVTPIIFKVQ